jgi:hypothetical protein
MASHSQSCKYISVQVSGKGLKDAYLRRRMYIKSPEMKLLYLCRNRDSERIHHLGTGIIESDDSDYFVTPANVCNGLQW